MRTKAAITRSRLVVFAILVASALGGTLLWTSRRQALYEGNSLSYWLDCEPGPGAYPQGIAADRNAVPLLIDALSEHPLNGRYYELWGRLPSWMHKWLPTPKDPASLMKPRQSAAAILGEMGALAGPAIPALVHALTHDTYANVHETALVSLVKLGKSDPDVITALLVPLQGQITETRFYAAAVLWRLGQRNNAVRQALTAPLLDPDPEKRAFAAWAMRYIERSDQGVDAALVAALADKNNFVRHGSALSLAN